MKIVWTGGHEPAQNPQNKKEKHTLAVNPVMNCSNSLRFLPAVPPGGADGDDRGDLPAHQLCLLQPLVLHCPGNLGDAHPPLSLPAPPQTLQGGSGVEPALTRTVTLTVLLTADRPASGAAGHRRHLHRGLLLHRGPVSVLGPLVHRWELCSHADGGPGLLPDSAQLPPARSLETRLQ